MKLIILFTVLSLFTSSIYTRDLPDEWREIDFSQVVRPWQIPEFLEKSPQLKSILEKSANLRSRRIADGVEVEPHSHPYQVACLTAVTPTHTSLCGGTILNPRAIMTAAHCINNQPQTLVIAGGHNIHQIEPSQQRVTALPQNYRVHPGWNSQNVNNDIAIMILPTALTFNTFVVPVRLPTGFENELFVDEIARAVGWGTVGTGQPTSPVLQKAYYRVMTNAQCANTYGSMIIHSTICGAFIGQGATCNSDSGGSFTVPRPGDNRPIQIGIVSFGNPPCGGGAPTAFARVTSFLSWITANQNP